MDLWILHGRNVHVEVFEHASTLESCGLVASASEPALKAEEIEIGSLATCNSYCFASVLLCTFTTLLLSVGLFQVSAAWPTYLEDTVCISHIA